jgi:hypothetical protein
VGPVHIQVGRDSNARRIEDIGKTVLGEQYDVAGQRRDCPAFRFLESQFDRHIMLDSARSVMKIICGHGVYFSL